jgi:two-component sensor histidine kinase
VAPLVEPLANLHQGLRQPGSPGGGLRQREIDLVVDAPDEVIGPDIAVPLGLLVTETITNAYKHAFEGAERGRIEVTMTRDSPSTMILTVRDSGRGFDQEAEADSGGLGRSLIDAFVRQLHGELDITSEQGTQVRVKFRSHLVEHAPAAASH